MKYLNSLTLLACACAVVVLAGCESEKHKEAALAHLGDEMPPDFLTGPAALSFTNLDGFSADAVGTTTADAESHVAQGQLLVREGRLLFQPKTTANVKKGKFVHGAMYFIWDTRSARGQVVSEALQAFAPISSSMAIASLAPPDREPVSETANGHPCHRIERIVTLSDGSKAKLTEWRADDLNRVPVRVRSESGGRIVTVELTGFRFDLPAPELYRPPAGFTEYQSPLAMINELLIRESTEKTGPSAGPGPPGQPAVIQQPDTMRRY